VNKFLKSLLRTAVYMMDQCYEHVDRASDHVSDMVDRSREVIYPENHELRNILSFAAEWASASVPAFFWRQLAGRKSARLKKRCGTFEVKPVSALFAPSGRGLAEDLRQEASPRFTSESSAA
jgi:hypothetical protein